MDALSSAADLSKLSDHEKQDLQQFIVHESQKSRIQQCEQNHDVWLLSSVIGTGQTCLQET